MARLGTGRTVVDYVAADYAELSQVRTAAARVLSLTDGIDLLINNAGMPGLPDRVFRGRQRADVVALCPGLNNTPLSAAMTGGIGGPPAHGAALVVRAGTSADRTGGYAENGRPAEPSPAIQSPAYRRDVATVIAARLQAAG